MTAVDVLLRESARRLAAAGIDSPRLDARLLLGEALGREVWPHETATVAADAIERFGALLARRLAREPVSRILGRRGFWSLDMAVGPDTLDPRPDSETLVEAARIAFADHAPPRRIVDLGTGTGCLLLAALTVFPEATGLGVDRSAAAVAVARENARRNGLENRAAFQTSDWDEMPQGEADLILSNPPYIPDADIDRLEPEVALFDPRGALAAGDDGLDAYRSLIPVLRRLLAPQGIAILELGIGQGSTVAGLAGDGGFRVADVRQDFGGVDRALVLKWNDTGDDCLDTNDFCLE